METRGYSPSRVGLERHRLDACREVFWNLEPAELYEHAFRNNEAALSANGAIVCSTGTHTGRSPRDKFFVQEPSSKDAIAWGNINVPISEQNFDRLYEHIVLHCRDRRLYVRDMFAGAEAATRLPIRIITETAWHNLFAAQLFIRPEPGSTQQHDPQFTVINVPSCQAEPQRHGTRSGTFVVIHLGKRVVLIGGTGYAGEIKKSIFTIMNYLLPKAGVLSMHCSANIGRGGDVALFFGLSGTGKTTLSADPERRLIGDDEHGWSDHGVFNIEGGCYAKCIKLSPEYEPQINSAIRFGTVLENVVMNAATRAIDFDSDEITENTRAAYPLNYIPGAVIPSVGSHPATIVFLACDAFGVLPPIAWLNTEQAMYHFLSGYTAKVAGTEAGVTEPTATFSPCFGEPFIPLPPQRYATMLGEKLARHQVNCWLVNTGWTGGVAGVGQRINLRYTRAMVRAAVSRELKSVAFTNDPIFGLAIPTSCPDVPTEVLLPRATWRDPAAYDAKARQLAALFSENFSRFEAETGRAASAATRVGAAV